MQPIRLALFGLFLCACGSRSRGETVVADAGTDASRVDAFVADAGAVDAGGSLDLAVSDASRPVDLGTPGPDAGTTCRAPSLFPGVPGTPSLYCPGASTRDCSGGVEQCCLFDTAAPMSGGISQCVSRSLVCPIWMGAAGPGYDAWQCEDAATDCSSGAVCCLGDSFDTVTVAPSDPSCPADLVAQGASGSVCRTTCAAAARQICESDAECPSGMTCRAAHVALYLNGPAYSGIVVGICM